MTKRSNKRNAKRAAVSSDAVANGGLAPEEYVLTPPTLRPVQQSQVTIDVYTQDGDCIRLPEPSATPVGPTQNAYLRFVNTVSGRKYALGYDHSPADYATDVLMEHSNDGVRYVRGYWIYVGGQWVTGATYEAQRRKSKPPHEST